jgi:prolyl oligopeptidase
MNWKPWLIAGVLMTSSTALAQGLTYPAARMTDQVDDYFGVQVHDPYRWMEDVDSPEVKTWVDAQNALTQSILADVPARARIHARLMELTNFERVSAPVKEGGRYFFRRNTGLQNQAVLYWQQGLAGEPRVLLDPNTLAADGTVALQSTAVTDDGKLMAYSLSEAGSDLEKIHVRTVATGQDLPDLVEWVKFSGISWTKDASGFFYSSYGVPKSGEERASTLKSVGSFHKIYFHKLGTPQTADVVVFERPDDKEMLSSAGVSDDGHWLIISQGKGDKNALAVKDLTQHGWESPSAPLIRIAPLDDAVYEWIGNDGRTVWMRTTKDAPNGKIVRFDLDFTHPDHPVATVWKTVVAEQGNSLETAVMVHHTILASYLADAQSDVELYTPDGKLIEKLPLPGIGLAGITGGKLTDDETFFTFTNYTTPPTVYRLDMKTHTSSVWKPLQLVFHPDEYETRQVFATSKDDTQVPLFVTYKKTTKLDGSAPAILYGYGGFNVSLGPVYSSSRLAWMEMGGIYAEAILRGGGEYGEKWHEAGTKTNKQNVFDDFIACAEYLINNSYTSPKKLAINGGSNGGLLVGAVELQRPELFGAVLAQVGVMDMLRFDKFTIGYAWKADYGSPSENEAEFHAILKYSPLHNIHAGTRYPPTLITTADHDDRVFPAHSFKFAAAMQAAAAKTPGAAPILIRVETRAGHGGGMPLSKQLDVTADMYAFLVKELGMQ